MLRDRRVWIGAGVLAVVIALAIGIVAARGSGKAQPIVQQGGETVSFSGTDPITGKDVSLADYAGKPVVVNIWASWCPGCSAEADDLRRFAADHSEAQLVGVDYQDSKHDAKAFYSRWRWTHPSVFDQSGQLASSLGLQGLPTTFFLDRQHRIASRIVGATDYAGFERGLEAALAAT